MQYYHDVAEDVVRIAVDEAYKEEAHQCLRQEFPGNQQPIYEICDPWESSCQPASDSPSCCCIQTEVGPGIRIFDITKQFFLFSGTVMNRERGITVAHATRPGNQIMLGPDHDPTDGDKTIGHCRETYENLQLQIGGKMTADLALLELNSRRCSVDNTVRWPFRAGGRTLQIKMYKGCRVPDDTRVMILDQNGDFQYGNIRRDHLTDKRLEQEDLHNVLAICDKIGQKEMSIHQPGDSGALVMSLPSKDSDVVQVYGIVNHIYTERVATTGSIERTLTVANSLWDVIQELRSNPTYCTEFQNNNNNNNNMAIDFA